MNQAIEPEFRLPDPVTLRLFLDGVVVFSSEKSWLHPLFDLETFFLQGCDPAKTLLADRIIGRAAAFLMARMGIRRLRTRVLSRLAIPVLDSHDIDYRCEEIIDRVPCATESLLSEIQDPEMAYRLVRARWERAKAGAHS